jgi:Mg/Co/Ni transporter MgtE
MQGIDWQALPVVAEMLGIVDVDDLIYQLVAIRDFHGRK